MANIINDAKGVQQTFSSWDSCMTKTYCKWPAIVGIIVASIIVLSIIWCIASCLCCGATLCGACVKCLTCGSCCGACSKGGGGGGDRRRSRHQDDYSRMPPTPYQGYQPQPAPMQYNHAGPQFATFDAPTKKINEDSLPAMPSWDNARSRQIEDTTPQPLPERTRGDDLEMGSMPTQGYRRDGYNQVPIREPISPAYDSPYERHNPYDSDLGAQRLGPSPRGSSMLPPQQQHRALSNVSSPTMSPAPTYRTVSPIATGQPAPYPMDPRRFSSGPISPPIPEHHEAQYNNNSYSAFTSTNNSTRYEPSEHQYTSYRGASPPPSFHTSDQQQGYRPPSLLQVGRKPVNGSSREV